MNAYFHNFSLVIWSNGHKISSLWVVYVIKTVVFSWRLYSNRFILKHHNPYITLLWSIYVWYLASIPKFFHPQTAQPLNHTSLINIVYLCISQPRRRFVQWGYGQEFMDTFLDERVYNLKPADIEFLCFSIPKICWRTEENNIS